MKSREFDTGMRCPLMYKMRAATRVAGSRMMFIDGRLPSAVRSSLCSYLAPAPPSAPRESYEGEKEEKKAEVEGKEEEEEEEEDEEEDEEARDPVR